MSYVKLFGGPWDGRIENVVDGCDGLLMQSPFKGFAPVHAGVCRNANAVLHRYRRSPDDPTRFVYDGTNE